VSAKASLGIDRRTAVTRSWIVATSEKRAPFHRTPLIWRLRAPDQDFFLFPRLKSIMKSARFADVVAIQERVTTILQSIPKETFADNFQKLYEVANGVL
jgi:hypothetical protein